MLYNESELNDDAFLLLYNFSSRELSGTDKQNITLPACVLRGISWPDSWEPTVQRHCLSFHLSQRQVGRKDWETVGTGAESIPSLWGWLYAGGLACRHMVPSKILLK